MLMDLLVSIAAMRVLFPADKFPGRSNVRVVAADTHDLAAIGADRGHCECLQRFATGKERRKEERNSSKIREERIP